MVDEVLRLDARRRELLSEVEQLKAEKNAASKAIGKIKDPQERAQAIAAMRNQGDRIPELDKEVAQVEAALQALMLGLPNLPHPDVPVGTSEEDNIVVRTEGTPLDCVTLNGRFSDWRRWVMLASNNSVP